MNNEHCGWVSLLKRKKKSRERRGGQVFVVIDVLECVSASTFLPHFSRVRAVVVLVVLPNI
jgi:hypothetical protein